MNRNDIRASGIGITAGIGVFAALYAWVEIDPWRTVSLVWARRQLTAAERGELDHFHAEREARVQQHKQQTAHVLNLAESIERVAAGFRPEALSTPWKVTQVQDLTTEDLVTEIVHAEQLIRDPNGTQWLSHRHALGAEWNRRDTYQARYTGPVVQQLRLQIYDGRIEAAVRAPYPTPAPTSDDFVSPEPVSSDENHLFR